MSRYREPLTAAEIANLRDADINFDDIPELDAAFWREARLQLAESRKDGDAAKVAAALGHSLRSGKAPAAAGGPDRSPR